VRPRRVTTVIGRGFPAGDEVVVNFGDRFIESATAVPDEEGSFRVQLVVLPNSPLGSRELVANSPDPDAPDDDDLAVVETTTLLIVAPTVQAPDFASRS
jgi:hypothetical protein